MLLLLLPYCRCYYCRYRIVDVTIGVVVLIDMEISRTSCPSADSVEINSVANCEHDSTTWSGRLEREVAAFNTAPSQFTTTALYCVSWRAAVYGSPSVVLTVSGPPRMSYNTEWRSGYVIG